MIEYLQGKKTYLVAAAGVLAALIGYLNGELSIGAAIEAAIMALGLGTLRAGVARGTGGQG